MQKETFFVGSKPWEEKSWEEKKSWGEKLWEDKTQKCAATTTAIVDAVKNLAATRKTNEYHQLKNIIMSSSPQYIGYLLVAAARSGIIRDVELLTPIAIANDCQTQINEAFCAAAEYANVTVMAYLLDNGAEIDYDNGKALKCAIAVGYLESVNYLLKKGVNVNIVDNLLLHCCTSGDYPEVLKALIAHGIDVSNHYKTVLDICYQKKYCDSAQVLIQWSARSDDKGTAPILNESAEDFERILREKEAKELADFAELANYTDDDNSEKDFNSDASSNTDAGSNSDTNSSVKSDTDESIVNATTD